MKKIIGQPEKTNSKLIDLIKKEQKLIAIISRIKKDFRNRIIEDIKINDDILDIGRGMRDKFAKIKAKKILTLM